MNGRSVTAASRILHTSQPSVTRLLAELEADLGFKLFDRHRRGMTPTEEAVLFFGDVERSFLGLRELEASARHIREHQGSPLTVGVSAAMALEFVPALVARIRRGMESFRCAMHVSNSNRLVDMLRSGRISLALMTPHETPRDMEILAERSFPYVAMMRRDHDLAALDRPINIADLKHLDCILPEQSFIAAKCSNASIAAGLAELSGTTAEVSFAAVAMLRNDADAALVDPFTAKFFASDKRLVSKPFDGAPNFDLILAHPVFSNSSIMRDLFIDRAVKEIERF